MPPRPAFSMRDRLSHLSFDDACKLLGKNGKRMLIEGGALELASLEHLRINDAEARIRWEPKRGGLSSRLVRDPAVRGGIRAECSACDTPCVHVAGLLSIILEQKTDLGLAALPPPVSRPSDESALIAQAIGERTKRAKSERMSIRARDPSSPWTDYTVTSALSGKTYRVALRGEARGVSYCSCPDFKTNTLGTCKHVLKLLSRAKRFPPKVRAKPYARKRITVHLRYAHAAELAIALPQRLSDAARAIVAPLLDAPIDAVTLVRVLRDLQAGGHAFFVTPDAEQHIERKLLAARLEKLTKEIRRAPERHPLRKTLLKQPLLPYQLDGIAFAARAGRAILADEMGLGKTIQGVGTAELLAREVGIRKVLVVCPASLKAQWRNEIQKFCDRSVEVVSGPARERSYAGAAFFTLCNYEQVLKDILHIEKVPWDLVILDEGQRIKNWEAKTTRVIKGLASPFALVLSGTPLENRLEELHSVVSFVDPHALGPSFRFLHRHQRRDEKGALLGFEHLDELRARLRPILLRRTRSSVQLELPSRSVEIVRITPSDEQKALHDAHLQTVAQIVSKAFLTEMDLLRLRMALLMCRMAADSTFLVDKTPPGYSSKLERLGEIFDDIRAEPDRKVILFSEWTTMLDLIEPLLAERDLPFVRLDGSVPQKKRQELVTRFQSDPATRFFLTTNAGSTGLNLQAANTVINVDLPWNPAILEQRIARAHRMGQTQPVSVLVLVSEQTLEENLLSTLSSKRELAMAALDPDSDVSAVDARTQAQDLKEKLEVLLGAKPDAPVDETSKQAATNEYEGGLGRTLWGAALAFLGELSGGDAARRSRLSEALRASFDPQIVTGESGVSRLSLAIPSPDALADMLRSVANALSTTTREAQASGERRAA